MRLAITTTIRPDQTLLKRADLVASRCGTTAIRRQGSLATVRAEAGVDLLYIVGREREMLASPTQRIAVEQGLLTARLSSPNHPMIRALSTRGRPTRVFDATLGLAGDALHAAAALSCSVIGSEVSPVVFSLLESGLRRLGPIVPAAQNLSINLGSAADILAKTDPVDVVMIAPMYNHPGAAPPGYALFREVAMHADLDAHTFEIARSKARTVVLKLDNHSSPPDFWPDNTSLHRGKSVSWWVVDSN